MPDHEEFHGWKEIAHYLRRSVRTAQRWERELGLPVRRVGSGSSEIVYARRAELEAWKQASGTTGNMDHGDEPDAAEPEGIEAEAPAVPTAPVEARRVVRRRRALRALVVGVCLLAFVAAAVWLDRVVRQGRGDIVASAVASEPRTAIDTTPLDPGPWPTSRHDVRRSGQSPLGGPSTPGSPALLFDGGSRTAAERVTGIVDLVSVGGGRLLFGMCGFVMATDLDGHRLWEQPLPHTQFQEAVIGLAVDSWRQAWITTAECPDVVGGIRTHLDVFSLDGALLKALPQGAAYGGPAIGPGGAAYTLDENTFVRAYTEWKENAWSTCLAGFGNRGLSVDSQGNLYAGTDGGHFHQSSLWSLDVNGEPRWKALKEYLGLVTIDRADRLYTASLEGHLFALDSAGHLRWQRTVGAVSPEKSLAVGTSGRVYATTTSEVLAFDPGGAEIWRYPAGANVAVATSPVLDRDENVYVGIGDEVVSLSPAGRRRWSVPIEAPTLVIIGAQGTLHVVSKAQRIYAIRD